MRIDIIKSKLKLMEEYITTVKKYFPQKSEEFKEMEIIKDGIYKNIENAIEEVIKICSIINTDLKLGIPHNREDIINALIEHNILSEDLGKRIREMKGFRNIITHKYGEIQHDIAFRDISKGFSDFEDFKSEILIFLKSYKKDSKKHF